MLTLTNLERLPYNPSIDNYMLLTANDYLNTGFNDIADLFDALDNSHDCPILVETDKDGYDSLLFLANIDKIVILKTDILSTTYYVLVQKYLLTLADFN